MAAGLTADRETFQTNVPARLDRLPWSRWHWRMLLGLGITWVIDGLEVTLVGAVSPVLDRADTLHFSSTENGLLNTAYLMGPCSAPCSSVGGGPNPHDARTLCPSLPRRN